MRSGTENRSLGGKWVPAQCKPRESRKENNLKEVAMKTLRWSLLGVALAFLIVPMVNLNAHPVSGVDSDGDGVPNDIDPCPLTSNHYACLKASGLWEWPAFIMSWSFSAENKMNSIRSCQDFSNYKNSLSGMENKYTFLAGSGLLGFLIKKIPVVGWLTILAAGIANAMHQAKANAADVYSSLCS